MVIHFLEDCACVQFCKFVNNYSLDFVLLIQVYSQVAVTTDGVNQEANNVTSTE